MLPLAVLMTLALLAFALPPDPLEIGSPAPMTDVKMTSTEGTSLSLANAAGENGLLVMFSWVSREQAVAFLEMAKDAPLGDRLMRVLLDENVERETERSS